MGRLAVIKLEGDLDCKGFRVTLEIGWEGKSPSTKIVGQLPPAPDLKTLLQQWEEKYRNIDNLRQIKPKQIIYNGSIQQRIEECRSSAKVLSNRFTDWLDSKEFRAIDKTLREEFSTNEEIRVPIESEDSHIQKLPWHSWDFFQRYRNTELSLISPAARQVESVRKPKKAVKILAILGHKEGIDITTDRKLLENLPDAEVTFLVERTHEEINDRLWEENWDILFFAGHSETEGDRGRIYINPTDSLTLEELKYGLTKAVKRGLQFAIFNSCDGLGLARKLAELHIPQTIVMREPVPDCVAQSFLKYFLAAFSRGESFYLAMREARERLQGLESKFPCASWLPVICQNPMMVPLTWAELIEKPQQFKGENLFVNPFNKKSTIARIDKCKWVALLLLGLGVGGWQVFSPQLATLLNNSAIANFQENQFPEFVKKLNWAKKIDPANPAVYYSQGWNCEKVRNFDCAKSHYQKSGQLGFGAAYSQLSFIAIKVDKDYSGAIELSGNGLELTTDPRVKYSLYKNRGWANLEQGNDEEALKDLKIALGLDSDRPAAYCLLAQVEARLGNLSEAIAHWKVCQQLTDSNDPDENSMLKMTGDRLSIVRSQVTAPIP